MQEFTDNRQPDVYLGLTALCGTLVFRKDFVGTGLESA
jgi:hypothetical protein